MSQSKQIDTTEVSPRSTGVSRFVGACRFERTPNRRSCLGGQHAVQTPRLQDLPIVPEPSEQYLNQRQLLDYHDVRESCLGWLLTMGRTRRPTVTPFRPSSQGASRMDQFYSWVWEDIGGYTAAVTHEHSDDYLQYLTCSDYSAIYQNALQMLFKWRQPELGFGDTETEITFTEDSSTHLRDYLTHEKHLPLRDIALEYARSRPTRVS